MIKLSEKLQEILSRPTIEYTSLITVKKFENGLDKKITDNPFDVTVPGLGTFISDGSLLLVDMFKISSSVDREEFSFNLSDPGFLFASSLEKGVINKRVMCHLVFYDYDELYDDEALLIYSGYGGSSAYVVNTSEKGEAYVKISCTSPMSDLDQKKGIYLSKEFMRNQNPNDSSCDQVYAGSGNLQLKWGKR
jgi:hypothetical protein